MTDQVTPHLTSGGELLPSRLFQLLINRYVPFDEPDSESIYLLNGRYDLAAVIAALPTPHAEGEGLQAHPLDGLLEPGARNFSVEASIAISLKRLADALAGKSDGSTCSLLELIADRMGPSA